MDKHFISILGVMSSEVYLQGGLTGRKICSIVGGMRANELVSLSQAAKILGVSRPTLYKLIREGKLFPIEVLSAKYLSVSNLLPHTIHKCATCFHYQDGSCTCREKADVITKNCPDWHFQSE